MFRFVMRKQTVNIRRQYKEKQQFHNLMGTVESYEYKEWQSRIFQYLMGTVRNASFV